MKLILNKWIFLAVAFTALVVSCKKDFNPDFTLPRHFKPGDIDVTAGQTQARLEWQPSLFGVNTAYTLEVSTDSTFQTNVVLSTVISTPVYVVTDSVLAIGVDYYARVKANANGSTAESGWVKSDAFRITGEQIFLPVLSNEITDSSVILRWQPSPGLTQIEITPTAGGTTITVPLTAADTTAHFKQVKGLTQLTAYTAKIFRNSVQKGIINFTTPVKSIFSVIITPTDDIITTVANAAHGDIIGLQPGTYDAMNGSGAYANIIVSGKTVTLQSTSGDPTDTKVNFKEITLKGTGAGVRLKGIEFSGQPGNADYFLNLTGLAADADPAVFTNIIVENSIVHHTNNAFLRGNRGGNNAHKIDTIKVFNTIAYANGTGSYHYFMIDKLEFKHLEISNSTIYDAARALISWATNLTMPAVPTVVIDRSTINSFGFGSRNNIILDANANVVNFSFTNSIIANTPKPGGDVGASTMRAGAASTIQFRYNNYFNLNGGNPLAPLTFPAYVSMSNNQSIDLGWTATTTTFNLPAASPLRTASDTGGPIGDPRWAL